jgi:hypothetical protein
MLRLFVLILLVANASYFAWAQGWLLPYGMGPMAQSEPHHLKQQVRPDALQMLSPSEFRRVEAQAQADLMPKECLQAGPFDATQSATLQRALEAALPSSTWQMLTTQLPERWIVYMGKFPNAEAQAKKRTELEVLKVKTIPMLNPELEPGLSLAGFDNRAAATAELSRLAALGIRTARVVQEQTGGANYRVKLPAVTEAIKQRLVDVKPAMAGKVFKACE